MISKEEVEKIAKLARLELTAQEIEKMQKDLSEILDYFDLLKTAPKVKIEKPAVAKASAGGARIDEVLPRDIKTAEKLINAAPDKKDGYIKVKTIL